MTIYEISQLAGVSIATVSRVMNNKDNVSDKTRRHVLKVIADLGYTPNVFARGLGLNTMRTIGLLCQDISDSHVAEQISILERGLRNNGYDSFLCCTAENLTDKKKNLELLITKRVDAIVMVGSHFYERDHHQHIEDAAKEVPLVFINGHFDLPGVYGVICDDFAAVREATQRLVNSGKKEILYAYDELTQCGERKLAGFKRGMRDFGFEPKESQILQCAGRVEDAKNAIMSKLSAYPKLNAVLASEDSIAIGALKAARALKLDVPEKFAVIGYDDSQLAICSEPELTSVNNMSEAMCTTAIRVLLDLFENKPVSSKITLSAEIVERGTTQLKEIEK